MKVPVHVSLEEDSMKRVDSLVSEGKYRNRSHALDEAVKLLIKRDTVKL